MQNNDCQIAIGEEKKIAVKEKKGHSRLFDLEKYYI